MRLVTWNCRGGGFRTKSRHVADLAPDVLTVQEMSRPDRGALQFAGETQPTFRDHRENPPWPRSIGVFSYSKFRIEAVDEDDAMFEFRRYRVSNDAGFQCQLAAIWTAKTRDPATTYRQALLGLRRYHDWISEAPTIVMGDFNDSARNRTTNWPEIMAEFNSLGMASAYHSFFDEPFGQETRPTFFPGGRDARPFHIDYCFLPDAWSSRINSVSVGTFQEWRGLSDHAPLVVDLDV